MSTPGIKSPQSVTGRNRHKKPQAAHLLGKHSRFAMAAKRSKKPSSHEPDTREDEPTRGKKR